MSRPAIPAELAGAVARARSSATLRVLDERPGKERRVTEPAATDVPRSSRLDRRKARTRQALIDAPVRLIVEGRGDRRCPRRHQ